MDYVSLGLLCEELERADTAFRVIMSVHVGLNSLTLLQWGTEDQKQRFLVPQAQGREAGHVRPHRARRRHRRGRSPDDRPARRRRLRPQRLQDLDQPGRRGRPLPGLRHGRSQPKRHKGITAFVVERGMDGFSTGSHRGQAGHPRRQHRAALLRRRARAGRQPHRRGGRGLHHRHERHRPGPVHGRHRRRRAGAGLPRRLGQVRPRAADLRSGDRPAPAGQADAGTHVARASRLGGCCAGRPPGSRTAVDATPARRAWPSGSAPTTPSRARSMRSRSTARTATRTNIRSSATCATARRPSSTRAPASCTRSSRPTTCWATARTARCDARRSRRRASRQA